MPNLIERSEAPPAATLEEAYIRAILSDDSLSMGERLLLLEGLLVHDSTPEPSGAQGSERFVSPARGLRGPRVRRRSSRPTPQAG